MNRWFGSLSFGILVSAIWASAAQSQAPRRLTQVNVRRDTLIRLPALDSARVSRRNLAHDAAGQDSSRQCRSTTGYVVFGGFIGFLVGSARYEKGQEQAGADFSILTRPLVIAPYVVGGMLLGHLIAPC